MDWSTCGATEKVEEWYMQLHYLFPNEAWHSITWNKVAIQ